MLGESHGRSYARIYERVRRARYHEFVEHGVALSGGRLLSSTGGSQAPLFLSLEAPAGERLAICAYVFFANRRETRNRPQDEHRLQVRYGDVNDARWRRSAHPVGFDPLGVDVTLVIGAHLEANLFVGLDPLLYDPLPMGISIEFKGSEIEQAQRVGWHVWERDNASGTQRRVPRSTLRFETVIAFRPDRLLDYVRLERDAQSLSLDPPLRFRAADRAKVGRKRGLHALEKDFSLSSSEILDIIRERPRLGMAVRGGVAERHLQSKLASDPEVADVELGQQEGPPDFFVRLRGKRRRVSIECKNASPKTDRNGMPKVETQKTRASKGDPKSRLYEPRQFDVIAASMYGPWRRWEFRYKRSSLLGRDKTYPDRIAAIQRIDQTWHTSLRAALEERTRASK